jgi:hypothetical protein
MTKTMSLVAGRAIAAAALAGLVGACSGHGVNPTTQSGTMAIPATPQSVSPAKIPVAPMAKPEITPMSTVKPMDAIGPANWQPIPGTGTFIAAAPDGSIWALSDQPSGADKYIYHYVNGVWTQAAGTASRLAVAPDGTLYAMNSGGGAYRYNSGTNTFTPLGGGCSDITVAKDGTVYVLSNGAAPGSDQAIWHYVNGTWTQAPGSGVRIAGNWDTQTYTINNGGGAVAPGGFYILNSAGAIYYENTSGAFAQLPGQASAIAPTSNAGILMLGYPASGSGNTIFYFDLDAQAYSQPGGSAIGISTNTSNIYAVGSGGGLYYSVVSTSGSLPTYFVNNSGITPAYFTIIGNNPNDRTDPTFYHVTATGQLVKFAQADRGPDGTADFNIPFPAPGTAFPLPLTRGARMYVSLGTKFKTGINPDLTWASPNGWSSTADPNFNTLWDNFEYDYLVGVDSHQPGMGINTTQVQMFGLPLSFTITGSSGSIAQMGFKAGVRTAFFNALKNNPPFDSLIVPGTATGTNVSPLRAISADQAILNGEQNIPSVPHFSNITYWDTYISNIWTYYKTHTLTANTSAFGTYTGTVNSSNQLVFTQANKPDIAFSLPPSTDAIVGNGALITPCNAWQAGSPLFVACAEIGSELSAYINRSTLLVDPVMNRNNPCPLAAINEFYQNQPVNIYAQLMHQYSYPVTDAQRYAPNGAAYGFGFDDNCNQSSVIVDNNNPSSMTITVQSF